MPNQKSSSEETPLPVEPAAPDATNETAKVHGVTAFLAKSLRDRWLCPNGHTLGMVITERVGRHDLKRLLQFPFAFTDDEYVPETLIVSKIDAGQIGCTLCGASRIWSLDPGDGKFLDTVGTKRG